MEILHGHKAGRNLFAEHRNLHFELLQFHLRVYCLTSHALTVHFYTRILALFAPNPYRPPEHSKDYTVDLTTHLTNTSLHNSEDNGESFVRLLDELVGYTVLRKNTDGASQNVLFTNDDVTGIMDQIQQILFETFEAAIANPVHFLVSMRHL